VTSGLKRKFTKFGSLSPLQQKTLINALLALPAFWVALRLFGFRRFSNWLSSMPLRERPSLDFKDIVEIAYPVNSAAFLVLGQDSCLIRSLYLLCLLRRRGVVSELRIGVSVVHDRLKAHAWVEVGGRPVNDVQEVVEYFTAFEQTLTSLVRPK
jgi:hypothetical protein